MMTTSERPDFQDDLDRDLNQVVEYLALSYLAEEVNFIAAPLRRIMVALLGALSEEELSPYRRHLRELLGGAGHRRAGSAEA
jgi:hypothetical protein